MIELQGGTQVYVEESHAIPMVSVVVALRSGTAIDPAGKEGLLRATLGMLRRGADGMNERQIEDTLDRLGSELSIDAGASIATIYGQVIERNLEPFIDLLSTLIRTPSFPDEELQRFKRETAAELVEARDNDRALAQRAFRRNLFKGHLYARSSIGTIPSVESLTRADVVAHYQKVMVRGNAIIGFSGDIVPERAKAMAEKLMAGVAEGAKIQDPVPPPEPKVGRHLVFVDKPERTQTQILIGQLGTSPHDDDHVPLTVANAVFGGTFTSRLMREVRSKRGWSYGASARLGIDRQRQSFAMWTFPAATDAAACLKLEIDLLQDLLDKGITPKELSFIKRYLIRSYAFEVDTASKRLHQALDIELLGLPADYYSGHVGHVEAVTLESANAALTHRLTSQNLLVVVVGTAADIFEQVKGSIPDLASETIVPYDKD
jgi:zinc protease